MISNIRFSSIVQVESYVRRDPVSDYLKVNTPSEQVRLAQWLHKHPFKTLPYNSPDGKMRLALDDEAGNDASRIYLNDIRGAERLVPIKREQMAKLGIRGNPQDEVFKEIFGKPENQPNVPGLLKVYYKVTDEQMPPRVTAIEKIEYLRGEEANPEMPSERPFPTSVMQAWANEVLSTYQKQQDPQPQPTDSQPTGESAPSD